MQLERSYFRHLKCETYDLRANVSTLDLLTYSLNMLSKPVDPKISKNLL